MILLPFHRLLRRALLTAAVLFATTLPARATMPPLSGPVPEAVSRAFETHLFQLPQARAGGPRFRTEATTGVWRVPVIMVSFADTSVRYGRGAFERALFDTLHRTGTGSVYDYFQWVSGSRLKVVGTVVDSVRLDHSRAYYANFYW